MAEVSYYFERMLNSPSMGGNSREQRRYDRSRSRPSLDENTPLTSTQPKYLEELLGPDDERAKYEEFIRSFNRNPDRPDASK